MSFIWGRFVLSGGGVLIFYTPCLESVLLPENRALALSLNRVYKRSRSAKTANRQVLS